MQGGSLTVVGTGIRLGSQLTNEARAAIESADVVLFHVPEPIAHEFLRRLNPRARSLHGHYRPGAELSVVYGGMVEEILDAVRTGEDVCVAFYGHPGVFATAGHEAVRRARAEGFRASMLPGVSAEDCLFADLGINPGASGCQSYEATKFLVGRPKVDTSAVLLLWQIGSVGRVRYEPEPDWSGLSVLAEQLLRSYPPDHEAIVYEASPYPVGDAIVRRVPLGELGETELSYVATLVLLPRRKPRRDLTMMARLGMPLRWPRPARARI